MTINNKQFTIYNKHKLKIGEQQGVALLLMVLVMGVLASLTLSVYLLLLTQTANVLTGSHQAEQAHYSAYSGFAATLMAIKKSPFWATYNQGSMLFDYGETKVHREISTADETGYFSINLTASGVNGVERRLMADFSPSSGPVMVVLIIDKTIDLGSWENCQEIPGIICAIDDFIAWLVFNPFARLTVVTFDDRAETGFGYENFVSRDRFSELQNLLNQISGKPNIESGGNLGQAIKLAHQLIIARPEFQDLVSEYKYHLVLITDGRPEFPQSFDDLELDDQWRHVEDAKIRNAGRELLKFNFTEEKVELAKKDGLAIHIVGVENPNDSFLEKIAGIKQARTEETYYYDAEELGMSVALRKIFLKIGKASTLVLREEGG